MRLAEAVNGAGMGSLARAVNPTTVTVSVPPAEQYRLMEFISRIEALTLKVDAPARVVINERTGTVVLGSQLRIATVAIAHGNLIVQIKNETQVSQPGAFAPIGSQTVVVPKSDVGVKEEKSQLARGAGGREHRGRGPGPQLPGSDSPRPHLHPPGHTAGGSADGRAGDHVMEPVTGAVHREATVSGGRPSGPGRSNRAKWHSFAAPRGSSRR